MFKKILTLILVVVLAFATVGCKGTAKKENLSIKLNKKIKIFN